MHISLFQTEMPERPAQASTLMVNLQGLCSRLN